MGIKVGWPLPFDNQADKDITIRRSNMFEMKWATRIKKAKVKGHFTDEDVKLASNFDSCAVGEKLFLENIEKEYNPFLDRIGMEFWVSVIDQEVEYAELVFKMIKLYKQNDSKSYKAIVKLFNTDLAKKYASYGSYFGEAKNAILQEIAEKEFTS